MGLAALVFVSVIAPAATCPESGKNTLLGFSDQIIRQLEDRALRADPFAYCNDQMAKRHLEANGFSRDLLQKQSPEENACLSEQTIRKTNMVGWGSSLVPTRYAKELTFRSTVMVPGRDIMSPSYDTMEEGFAAVRSTLSTDPCKFPVAKGNVGGSYAMDKLRNVEPADSESWLMWAAENAGSLKLCSELVPLGRLSACKNVMSTVVADMRARGNAGEFTQPALFAEVIGSGAYDAGLKMAALKMLERYERDPSPGANLYSDLRQSFRESGQSEATADAMTWKTLGLLSTGGANMTTRLSKLIYDGHRWPTVTALSAIAGLLPALDHRYGREQNLYSFPPGVKARCDTSKSYHFWMAAFLAHDLAQTSGDSESAMAAAFSANKAYHNVGNFTQRGAGSILAHSPFSPASQVMRADLSYAMAGAAFGATRASGSANELSVDQGLSTLIESSRVQRPLDKSEIGGPLSYSNYARWSRTFAANELYAKTRSALDLERPVGGTVVIPPGRLPKCR